MLSVNKEALRLTFGFCPTPKYFAPQKPIVTLQMTYLFSWKGVYSYETRIVPLIGNIQAPQVHVTCIIMGMRSWEP